MAVSNISNYLTHAMTTQTSTHSSLSLARAPAQQSYRPLGRPPILLITPTSAAHTPKHDAVSVRHGLDVINTIRPLSLRALGSILPTVRRSSNFHRRTPQNPILRS